SVADEDRIRAMTRLIGDGLSAAQAARQALTADGGQPAIEAPLVDQLADQLRTALDSFDGTGAHASFDRLLASVSLDVVLADVLVADLHSHRRRHRRAGRQRGRRNGAPRRHSPGGDGDRPVEPGSTGWLGRLTPERHTRPVMSG